MNHKKKLHLILLGLISSIAALSLPASEEVEEIAAKELLDSVIITAEVAQINYETREVTLAGPLGNLVTLDASDEIERFNEIEVGDLVAATYMTYTLAEFREPTAEELENPLVILAEGGKAGTDESPAAAMGAQVRAVVSIELINREQKEVTIKGPRGNYLTVPVQDEAVLKQVKVGERVVLTYAEAVALSLEKVTPVEGEASEE